MNKKIMIFACILLILFSSLTLIHAADTDDDSILQESGGDYQDLSDEKSLEKDNQKVVKKEKSGDTYSFSDLNNDIIQSGNSLNISRDYTFDSLKDSQLLNGIIINNTNLTINGNNHVIDAKNGYSVSIPNNTTITNAGSIFNINNSNIKIYNLTIKNAANVAVNLTDSTLSTENVVFINNTGKENGGAISGINSSYTSVEDTFIDNYARFGSAIFLDKNSTLYVDNDTFKANDDMYWGLMEVRDSSFTIANTTFANMSSNYTTVLHSENGSGSIINCEFVDLEASLTAGAIGLKLIENPVLIENCSFINVGSNKNAGALFFEMVEPDPISDESTCIISINNSFFDGCSSEFGGAIVQLEGLLNIENSNFTDNYADLTGGAIHTSYANITLNNVNFKNNKVSVIYDAYGEGGAAFVDKGTLKANNCNFTGNIAKNGGALYVYDSDYTIKNSYFKNNGENIYTSFDGNNTLLDDTNIFVDGENSINNIKYNYVFENEMAKIDYDPIILDNSLVNSSKFDLRDYGLVSSVKAQGWMGACWTFGTAAAVESALLKATNKKLNIDVSENNIHSSALKYFIHGGLTNEGGDEQLGSTYVVSWMGALSSEEDSYDELGKLSPIITGTDKYIAFDVIQLQAFNNLSMLSTYKDALVKYGVLATTVYGADRVETEYFNLKTSSAYYTDKEGSSDHIVAIVGWDDNYSRNNFKTTPPGDGAWIIKNSWGTEWGDEGYYYLSYYDMAFAKLFGTTAFVFNNEHNYTKNYQYDLTSPILYRQNDTKYNQLTANLTVDELLNKSYEISQLDKTNDDPVSYANRYLAIEDDLIGAVGTWFNKEGVNYTISILTNDNLVYTQSGKSSHAGYETIKLKKPVAIKKDEYFTVKIISNRCPTSGTRNQIMKNVTFSDYNQTWVDLSQKDDPEVAVIKAYTIADNSHVTTYNITTDKDNAYIYTQYFNYNGEKLSNTTVSYKIGNKTYESMTDDDGVALLNVALPPGIYTLQIINPVNNKQTNVTFTIEDGTTHKSYPSIASHKRYDKEVKHYINKKNTRYDIISFHKIIHDDKIIHEGNYLTLGTLNDIFKREFINGQLVVFIDGQVVFNDSVTDDISRVIFEIIEKFLGKHSIKVEFTDKNNNTRSFEENIIIK